VGYEGTEWEEPGFRRLELPEERVRTRVYQFGDGSMFTDVHRRTLERSSTVTVYQHATALALESEEGEGSRVASLRVGSAPGRGFRVGARQVVLACGGLATTQLLLSSVENGSLRMGRAEKNLGRYFMDHPLLYGGEVVPTSPAVLDAMGMYDLRDVRGTPVMGHLQLADELLRTEPVLNLSAVFFPRSSGDERERLSSRQQAGVDAALRIRRLPASRARPQVADVRRALIGFDGVVRRAAHSTLRPTSHLSRGGWSSESPRARRRYDRFEVIHQAEQAPHYENRVQLGDARDAFGTRRVTVDWRWHDEDVAGTMRAQEVFATELERAGVGRFEIARAEGRPVVQTPSTGHFMGLTRMSRDPSDGVVDADCRVHESENLYVASGSVIPTGGFANPTLTIVALALRVAEHLQKVLTETMHTGMPL
jgi:choline dehydrogenase-like flavoprotein